MMSLRVLAIFYCMLLSLDGMLTIVDNADPVRVHHFSMQTSISLAVVSIPVFIVGLILSIFFKWKPRWPLLVSSGLYSAMVIAMLIIVTATAVTKGLEALGSIGASNVEWRGLNLVVAVLQIVVSGVCLVGAFHHEAQSESSQQANRMEPVTPRQPWRTTLGVLGIVFGCFGMLTALQSFLLPMMLEIQRKMFESMSSQSAPGQAPKGFIDLFQPVPAWFTPWSMLMGSVSVVASGLYIFSAIWLLLRKTTGARLFGYALIASIFVELSRAVGLAIAAGKWGIIMAMGGMFGVVIDVVLLVVLLAHRKHWRPGDTARAT